MQRDGISAGQKLTCETERQHEDSIDSLYAGRTTVETKFWKVSWKMVMFVVVPQRAFIEE